MEIIYKQRQEGKTTDLLEFANKQKGYNLIVCRDKHEVARLWTIILKNKYKLPQPITFSDFINERYYGIDIENIFIDNADMLLQQMTTTKISGITITKDD